MHVISISVFTTHIYTFDTVTGRPYDDIQLMRNAEYFSDDSAWMTQNKHNDSLRKSKLSTNTWW